MTESLPTSFQRCQSLFMKITGGLQTAANDALGVALHRRCIDSSRALSAPFSLVFAFTSTSQTGSHWTYAPSNVSFRTRFGISPNGANRPEEILNQVQDDSVCVSPGCHSEGAQRLKNLLRSITVARLREILRFAQNDRSCFRAISARAKRLLPLFRSSALPLLILLTGCGGAEPDALRLELDKRDPERLLRFYFGSYLGPEGGDPFEAGLLSGDDDLRLHPAALDARWQATLDSANADGTLDWDELVDFLDRTYADARDLPPTLDAFRTDVPYAEGDSAWFTVEIDGVMTNARRRIFVPMESLRAALEGYHENDERLLYPVGTALVGEHRLGGEVAETTVMQKRADGFWDFFVYGTGGALAPATATEPRPLRAPTQCVGCHVGQKLFEPEKSFPAEAPDGPFGPRGIRVGGEYRNAEVVAFFDEHARRSDTVLGIYGTLFVSKLLADRAAGRLAPEDAALLESLNL